MPDHRPQDKKPKHRFQEFTPAEQKCISAKVSKLRGEGKDEAQAVAQAIQQCAPGKARKSAHEIDQTRDIPSYRAAQATDGTWTIFDVPVFAAHTEERPDRELEFDGAWLDAALDRGSQRQAEGYLAPLHVRHHGEALPVEAAGKFRLTRVGEIQHGGEPVKALFADLVGVRPEVYERIRKGELSYRSVEILDVNKPEIDSLALLDDEVPFFRFPLLRVAEDQTLSPQGMPASLPVVRYARGGQPVLAYSARGHHSAALFRFQEQTMADPTPLTGAAPATDPTKKAGDPAAILQMLMSGLQQLAQLLQQPGAAPGPGPVEQPAPPPTPPMQQSAPVAVGLSHFTAAGEAGSTTCAPSTDPPADPPADLSRDGEISALQGQVQALTAKFAASDAQKAVDVEAATLSTLGFSGDQVTSFRAKASEQGVTAALSFSAGLKAMGAPSDPPTHWTGEIRGEAPDPPELAKFAQQGPEALNQAREFYGSWKRTGCEVSFEDFYAANKDADAFMAAGRTKE